MIGLNSKQEGTVWEEVAPFPTVIRPPPLPLPLLGVFETNYKMAASDGEC